MCILNTTSCACHGRARRGPRMENLIVGPMILLTGGGVVDGTDYLRFRRKQVDIEHIRAQPIRNAEYNFSAPLPDYKTEVFLSVEQGRGEVEVVQHPDFSNDYTAIVRVDDGRDRGASTYDLYLYWEKRTDTAPEFSPEDMDWIWEGRVDGIDELLLRKNSVEIIHHQSRPIREDNYSFHKSLPRRAQQVQLYVFEGRGKVEISEQPSAWNDYSLKLRLDDSGKRGDSLYPHRPEVGRRQFLFR